MSVKSKIICNLKYKDLYAIKHALQTQIRIKKSKIKKFEKEIGKTEEIQKLKKDIKQEEKILEYVIKKNKIHERFIK